MMGQWMNEAGQMEEMNKMMEAWGSSWAEADELKMATNPNVLTFQQSNPYMEQQQEA